LYIGDLYTSIPASTSIVIQRYASDLSRMPALQAAVTAGTAAVSVALNAAELASGLAVAEGSVQSTDVAAVAAAAAASPDITIRKAFTSVASTDIAVFAANALPYKMRIMDAYLLISTVQAGSSLQLWPQAAGAGTAITVSTSSAVAGKIPMPLTGNASVVLTPGATIGIFMLPSAHTGVVGELVIVARRES
jgi:hypothetical protein